MTQDTIIREGKIHCFNISLTPESAARFQAARKQHETPTRVTKSIMQMGSSPHRMKMVAKSLRSSRLLAGMPLAWGAKAHAGTCHRYPFFCRPLRARGYLCALTGIAAFFFRGKWR